MTIVFCLPYFSGEISVVPEQDLTFHLNRITGLSNAFEEGQILPKIYPYANYGKPGTRYEELAEKRLMEHNIV